MSELSAKRTLSILSLKIKKTNTSNNEKSV